MTISVFLNVQNVLVTAKTTPLKETFYCCLVLYYYRIVLLWFCFVLLLAFGVLVFFWPIGSYQKCITFSSIQWLEVGIWLGRIKRMWRNHWYVISRRSITFPKKENKKTATFYMFMSVVCRRHSGSEQDTVQAAYNLCCNISNRDASRADMCQNFLSLRPVCTSDGFTASGAGTVQ